MKIASFTKYLRYRVEIHRERQAAPNHLIIAEPVGGLANRMRVIASGIWLKNKIEGRLAVVWSQDDALNCPYEQIFEYNENFKIIGANNFLRKLRPTNQATWSNAFEAYIKNKFIGIDYCIPEYDFYTLIKPGKLDILQIARENKTVYFRTSEAFGDYRFAYKLFNPIPQLRDKIELISKAFTESTIGIHIRRTDSLKSIEHSPLHLFIEKMRHEISINRNANFFLATDDLRVEKVILNEFGQKVITHNKELGRGTVKGIQDAVIDLYCLSRTSKVIGSYWSSFSAAASRINQIQLEVLRK